MGIGGVPLSSRPVYLNPFRPRGFSDFPKTNDPREINLGKDTFFKALEVFGESVEPQVRNTIIAELGSRMSEYFARKTILSCSFSSEKDQLPMWREYASNAKGLCIGFRATAIKSMPIRIQKVNYVKEADADGFAKLLKELIGNVPSELHARDIEIWLHLVVPVIFAIVSAKHVTWEYEKEIRGTHAAVEIDGPVLIKGTRIPSYVYDNGDEVFLQVSVRGDPAEINYIPIPFGRYRDGRHEPERAIESVTLGPNCSLTIEEVRQTLEREGFTGFSVEVSQCVIL